MPIFQESRNTVRQAVGRNTGFMLGTFTVTSATPALVRAADLAFLHLHDAASDRARRAANTFTVTAGTPALAELSELALQYAYESSNTQLRQAIGSKSGGLLGTFAVTSGTPGLIRAAHLAYTHLQHEVPEAAKQAAASTFAMMDGTPTNVDLRELAGQFAYESSSDQLRQVIGRRAGWMVGAYTATNGSTTQIRANELAFRNAEQPRGLSLYIYGGTGSGQTRTIISATAFTQGSGTTLYPEQNFATAPDSTSTFELWKAGIVATDINSRIADAKRAIMRETLAEGVHVNIYSGGGASQTRTIVSLGAFTQGSGLILHPGLDFSPAPSTNSMFEVWRGVNPDEIDNRITDVKRQMAREALAEGIHIYVATGGGAGQARTIISLSTFTQGTGIYLHPQLNFSPAPSTDASFELWRTILPVNVNGMIDDSIRRVAKKFLQHKEDSSIHMGDPLRHWGSFERWPDGAALAPDGFTLTGTNATVARESVIKYSGRYSAAVTNGASQTAYLESDNIPGWPKFAGEVVSIRAKVYVTTANRVRLQLLDGVDTNSGTYHPGTGGWEEIEIANITVNAGATQLQLRLTTDTGTAITAYWGKAWMEHDGKVYDFELPASGTTETAFAYISEVWAESLIAPGEFNERVPNEFWDIDGDSTTRRIIFKRGLIDQYVAPGRGVKLVGQRHARLPTADTDNLEVDPEYVRRQASVYVMDSLPWTDTDRSRRDRLSRDAEQLLQEITTAVYPDAAFVEAF